MTTASGNSRLTNPSDDLAPIMNTQKRQQGIARKWYRALLSAGLCQLDSSEAVEKFTDLTSQVIAFLLAEAPQMVTAREIGAHLAGLPSTDPQVLEISGQLWARQLTEGGLPVDPGVLYPRLVTLLNGMAAGFGVCAREIVLANQEDIRLAMAEDLYRATKELKRYQSQLEEMLAERTRELRESEEQFRAIADTSIEGIYQSDGLAANYIYVNEAYAKMVGYTKEELLGKNSFEMLAEDDFPKLSRIIDDVRKNKPVEGEMRLKHKDGHLIDIHFSMVPMILNGRSIRSGIILDITEQKRTQEKLFLSEERYRTLAEASPDMIFIIGRDDCIQYVNSFAIKFLNSTKEGIIGQPRGHFFPAPANDHQRKHLLKALEKGKTVYVEGVTRVSGRSPWLGTWLVPLRDVSENITAVMGVARDITGQKRAELQIRRARSLLERRVKERTAALTTSQDQLRQLTNQLVTLLEEERRRISRELHDEAGQALISLKYVLASIESEIPKRHVKAKERLRSSMDTIDRTMNQIRTLTHSLRPPALEIMGINLCLKDYCEEMAKQIGLSIDYRGEEIPNLPDEIGISLYRFVQEALTNTLKHAHANKVRVSLTHHKDLIILSVLDNGLGMRDDTISDGIGLIGIKERLKLIGGSLEIRSAKNRGAKLSACVPWRAVPEEN